MTNGDDRPPRMPWPLWLAAAPLFLVAAVLSCAVISGSLLYGADPGIPTTTAVDVAQLAYEGGAWSVRDDGSASFVANVAGWSVREWQSELDAHVESASALGLPLGRRGDANSHQHVMRGTGLATGEIEVGAGPSAITLDPGVGGVAAPLGAYLVHARPAASAAPADVSAWIALLEAELRRQAARTRAERIDAGDTEHVDDLCRAAALFGATGARDAVRTLAPDQGTDDVREAAARVLLSEERRLPVRDAVRTLLVSSNVDADVVLTALAANRELRGDVRAEAERRLELLAVRRASDRRRTADPAAALLLFALLLALAAPLVPRLARLRRPLLAFAVVPAAGLVLLRSSIAGVVPADVIGLFGLAWIAWRLASTRRWYVAALLFATAATGRLFVAPDPDLVPEALLAAAAGLAVVLVAWEPVARRPVRAEQRDWPARPARALGAGGVLVVVVLAVATTFALSFAIARYSWSTWFWPRTHLDVVVHVAATPLVAAAIWASPGVRASMAAVFRVAATLFVALHVMALSFAISDSAPDERFPHPVGVGLVYAVVVIAALRALVRAARAGDAPVTSGTLRRSTGSSRRAWRRTRRPTAAPTALP